MKQIDRIIEQRAALTATQPLYGDILARLRLEQDNETTETVGTDGADLRYNTGFISGLDDAELRYTLAFLALLIAYDFRGRRSGRDPQRWAMACNYVANTELSKIPGLKRPSGTLYEAAYDGLIADEIYDRLPVIEALAVEPFIHSVREC